MTRLLTTLALFLFAADATAGPIVSRVRERVQSRRGCSGGQCAPAVAFRPPAAACAACPQAVTAGFYQPVARPVQNCPGGVCPLPR